MQAVLAVWATYPAVGVVADAGEEFTGQNEGITRTHSIGG